MHICGARGPVARLNPQPGQKLHIFQVGSNFSRGYILIFSPGKVKYRKLISVELLFSCKLSKTDPIAILALFQRGLTTDAGGGTTDAGVTNPPILLSPTRRFSDEPAPSHCPPLSMETSFSLSFSLSLSLSLSLLEHIVRMSEGSNVRGLLVARVPVEWRRPWGRPRSSWLRTVV